MLLDVSCKAGRLEVLEEGTIRVRKLLSQQTIWQVPCSAVVRITAKDHFAALNITFYTEQAQYQADLVSKAHAAKLYALFPHLEIGTTPPPTQPLKKGRHWYQDPSKRTYIATYTNEKEMQKDVVESGKYGWIPQGTESTVGHFSARKMITGTVLTGGVGLFLGAGRSKDKMTITYVRTPEWLAQNG